MTADWPGREVVAELRQRALLDRLAADLAAYPAVCAAALLVGSFAAGRADALSDLDLLLLAPEGAFAAAWARRGELRLTGALAAWDVGPAGGTELAVHKWLTPDLVFVEALIATPSSGVRLAEPYVVLAGALPGGVARRPPVSRAEMGGDLHPIERAYDELKAAVRQSRA